MTESSMVRVEDIMQEFDVSESQAYKIIRTLNAELEKKGFCTVRGRVSRNYLMKRFYGMEKEGA